MFSDMNIFQVAFSVFDLDTTCAWYEETFGFLPSGEHVNPPDPAAAACLGLSSSSSRVRWMVDQQDFFQLEFFRFADPTPRPLRRDWSPSDAGYSSVGLHVRDFDAVASRISGSAVGPIVGPTGSRRLCAKDPEGILLEIMEDDARAPGAGPRRRPDVPVAVRCVRLVVADLERARRFFVGTLGLRPAAADAAHTPEHERLWGLGGAQRRSLPLWSGDFLLEIVSYDHPVGRPRPDGYRISDQGILNIAIGSRTAADYRDLMGRVRGGGYHANPEMAVGPITVSYVEGDENVSVECVSIPDPEIERHVGFEPRN